MTALEFLKKIGLFWGPYQKDPLDEAGKEHGLAVWEYIKTKSPRYLDELYRVLQDERPSRWGPPERPDLKALHPKVSDRLEYPPARDVMKQLMGPGDELVSKEEVAQFWNDVSRKLRERAMAEVRPRKSGVQVPQS